jgi:hypothetical protein
MVFRLRSVDEWWTRTGALAGPLARHVAALPAGARDAIRARLRAAALDYETPRGLELPAVSLVASARR